jgi:hypothetical protein
LRGPRMGVKMLGTRPQGGRPGRLQPVQQVVLSRK